MDRNEIRDIAPSGWELSRCDPGTVAAWEHTVRDIEMCVEQAPPESGSTYRIQREIPLETKTLTPDGKRFEWFVQVTRHLMRGTDGIPVRDISTRLGLQLKAASAVSSYVKRFSDFQPLFDTCDGDIARLPKVGASTATTVQEAMDAGVLDAEAVVLQENHFESTSDDIAVYMAVPAFGGYRLRKEWQNTDGRRQSSVRLPIDNRSKVFQSLEEARTAVEEIAPEREMSADETRTNQSLCSFVTD